LIDIESPQLKDITTRKPREVLISQDNPRATDISVATARPKANREQQIDKAEKAAADALDNIDPVVEAEDRRSRYRSDDYSSYWAASLVPDWCCKALNQSVPDTRIEGQRKNHLKMVLRVL
jgi:hypothetical protein